MLEFILDFQWELFILLEVLSVISLLAFGLVRYLLDKRNPSLLFLFFFVILLIIEAIIALVIYRETGEISTFQIIITVFVVYACTLGIFDFMKLDRWMRKKIGGWRGVELLSEKDREIMNKQKDPKHVAKKYRYSSTLHLIVFVSVQAAFWIYGTDNVTQMMHYLRDFSWIGSEDFNQTPYANETIYGLSMVWGIVFIIDFIYSWSYTIFPSNSKG